MPSSPALINEVYADQSVNAVPVAVTAGALVRGSRISGADPASGALPGTIEAQLANCHANLRQAIENAGGTLDNVAHVSMYFADFARDREAMNPPWVAAFPKEDDRPTYKFMTTPLPDGQLVSMDFWGVLDARRELLAIDGVAHTNPIPLGVLMGGYLFSSRMLPFDPATGKAAEGPEAQVRFLFGNSRALLNEAGMDWANVFQARTFLADLAFVDLVRPLWEQAFPDAATRPALNPVRYGAGVLQVMIEFVAHKPA